MKKPTVYVVEEDETVSGCLQGRFLLRRYLVDAGKKTGEVVHALLKETPPLIVIGPSRRRDWDGIQVAARLRRWDRHVRLILVNAYSSEARAVAALRAGVNDYFKMPVPVAALTRSVQRHLARSHALQPQPVPDPEGLPSMIGDSPPMREIKAYLLKVAPTDSTVLITGETGTGKELAAEVIHRNSPRRQRPLVCINCAALPDSLLESELFGFERGAFTGAVASKKGKFELARGGTVFLDEIGDMSDYAQAKILRAIERKEIYRLGGERRIPLDLRIVAASNQDLEGLAANGRFRKDLYYRLNVARVHLAPLRDRKDDIYPLLQHYIREMNNRFHRKVEGFTEEALSSLLSYHWPGNIRELKNLLEATFINLPARRISFMDLPRLFRDRLQEIDKLPEMERERLLSALYATNWNKSQAAQKLHWSRMTLYRKMAKYHIFPTPEKKPGK
jgi:DNA-binding NtrC family response regulator